MPNGKLEVTSTITKVLEMNGLTKCTSYLNHSRIGLTEWTRICLFPKLGVWIEQISWIAFNGMNKILVA